MNTYKNNNNNSNEVLILTEQFPGLLHAIYHQITRLLEANQRLRVLVRDDMKEEIKSKSVTSNLSFALFWDLGI